MITIGDTDSLNANPNIKQIVEVVQEYDKPTKFTQFMERAYQGKVCKAIVFTETKRDTPTIDAYWCLNSQGKLIGTKSNNG